MKIVKVFKTDVQDPFSALFVIQVLQEALSHCRINFDLDDCDRVLRVESHIGSIEETQIQLLVARCGHYCVPL